MQKIPAFAAIQGGIRRALKLVGAVHHMAVEIDGAAGKKLTRVRWRVQPEVDRLLIRSHISLEMYSRTVRAFSRAAATQETMEFGFSFAKVTNSHTVSEFVTA